MSLLSATPSVPACPAAMNGTHTSNSSGAAATSPLSGGRWAGSRSVHTAPASATTSRPIATVRPRPGTCSDGAETSIISASPTGPEIQLKAWAPHRRSAV